MRRLILAPAAIAGLMLTLLAACGGGDGRPVALVTIEPLATATRDVRALGVPTGGKPAVPRATATPAAPDATAPPDVESTEPAAPPSEGRWIDVDVTNFVLRLMDGAAVLQEIAPVAVGEQIDTGDYVSTQTGLFHVYSKDERLVYDAPYDTYISHWVGFDPDKDNGFHSFLKDASGAVVDAGTGRVSNGCIRSGQSEAVFAFAEIGMPVYVHW